MIKTILLQCVNWLRKTTKKPVKSNSVYADRCSMFPEEHYCYHCEKDTLHINIAWSFHERDSSADQRECSVCGWYYTGYSGKYNPPRESRNL